jgi:hypothetical protein
VGFIISFFNLISKALNIPIESESDKKSDKEMENDK